VFKHIGSGNSDDQVAELRLIAEDLINQVSPLLPLEREPKFHNLLSVEKCDFIGTYYSFFYEVIADLMTQIGLDKIRKDLLFDLVVIRILEPASKLRSITLLEQYFGIKHRRQTFYESAPKWLNLKDKVEGIVMSFAKQNYAFNFDVLFYDVTTLYFETFKEDELRRNGFSKDNKSQQPQILVALMVTKEGFPISYEIFPGNTFEGHTIIPVVKKIINKYEVKEFTIVADAAMISAENVKQLVANRINYIVGARLGNISDELLEKITKANLKQDGKSIRIKTENGYLICSYSSVRYRKDKYEMEKQIERAKQIVENPAKNKKLKFTKAVGEKIELNKRLIDKHTKLLGIKGYYTNLEEKVADNSTIINRYHELYRIEQAFRISKNDLETRPVFHFKEEPIKLHLLICFMALVLSKHIELKSNQSIRFFIDELKKVTDARIYNHLSRKEIRMRAKISKPVSEILSKLNLSY
jgi:transposase